MSEAEFACIDCGENYPPNLPRWRCGCGGPLEVEPNAVFTRESLASRPTTLWRYREAIPIQDDSNIVTMDEGMTPLVSIAHSGMEILCKLDFLFPTGSFKDRGATVLMSKMKEWGLAQVLMDSSGNAAAAVAAYAARAGIECDIYAPASTSQAKCAQITAYGARLHKIPGPRAASTAVAMEAAKERFYASHFWNPWFNHGTKTWAFEVWEQLGFTAPNAVVAPTGHGSALLGAYLGFSELLRAGYISELPKIFAAQAARCAPMVQMWEENLEAVPEITPEETIAEGISIAAPVRWKQMIEAVRESGGCFISVEDETIPPLLREFGAKGVLMEPTSAVAFAAAGLLREQGKISQSESVVVPVTGHGLKAADKLEKLMSV
ncbi:MAG: threonine synthase [Nitrospinae bacterium]|nr:threonine synthase [Nitrospinota bacterium]